MENKVFVTKFLLLIVLELDTDTFYKLHFTIKLAWVFLSEKF